MLTKGEITVLEKMAQGVELVESIPGGWYLDEDRVSGRVGWSLLRKVLISEQQYSSSNFKRYYINEWGRNALALQHHAHLTPESLASSQAVINASALEQSDSDTPPAQAQVA